MNMDIVIRLDFILQDMKTRLAECTAKKQIDDLLTDAWRNEIKHLVEQGYVGNYIYCGVDREDLKQAIDDGINIYDLHKITEEVLHDSNKTMYFSEVRGGFKVYSVDEINNEINKHLENIAYNTLYNPFDEPYKQLYKEYVIPMIKQQQ